MYLPSLAQLALGSRLKSLSDHFYGAVDEVYRACGAGVESRWFPVLRFLWEHGETTVSDVATAKGRHALAALGPIWVAVRRGIMQSLGEEGLQTLLAALSATEQALQER